MSWEMTQREVPKFMAERHGYTEFRGDTETTYDWELDWFDLLNMVPDFLMTAESHEGGDWSEFVMEQINGLVDDANLNPHEYDMEFVESVQTADYFMAMLNAARDVASQVLLEWAIIERIGEKFVAVDANPECSWHLGCDNINAIFNYAHNGEDMPSTLMIEICRHGDLPIGELPVATKPILDNLYN